MTNLFGAAPAGVDANTLRVDTLIRVRWLAIAGQGASVLLAAFGLGVDLPLVACLVCIAVSAALNLALRRLYRRSHRLSGAQAGALLGYDILQLAVLLHLTGGLQNPFAVLLLAPVAISAASLPLRVTATLYGVMVAAAAALAAGAAPMPWLWGQTIAHAPLYTATAWLALAVGAAFVAGYASRVAAETQQLSDALAATDLALARQQHLHQLDGLAAAAAHELGTPLGTIRLVTREWLRGLPAPPGEDDIRLVSGETERCRTILGKLSSLRAGAMHDWQSVAQIVEDATAPHRRPDVAILVDLAGEGEAPVLRRNPALSYGLGNLVENAVDFARASVRVTARWSPAGLTIVVADDGPGFPGAILRQVGDPYLRSARAGRRAKTEGGLGLGLFISKTLLERSGATFALRNAAEGGAVASLAWERDRLDEGPAVGTASQIEPNDELARARSATIPDQQARFDARARTQS